MARMDKWIGECGGFLFRADAWPRSSSQPPFAELWNRFAGAHRRVLACIPGREDGWPEGTSTADKSLPPISSDPISRTYGWQNARWATQMHTGLDHRARLNIPKERRPRSFGWGILSGRLASPEVEFSYGHAVIVMGAVSGEMGCVFGSRATPPIPRARCRCASQTQRLNG